MTADRVQDRRHYVQAVQSTAFHQAGLAYAREMLRLSSCNEDCIQSNLFYLTVKSDRGWYSCGPDLDEVTRKCADYHIVERALAAYCEVTGLPMPTWEQLDPGGMSERGPDLLFTWQYPQPDAWHVLYESVSSEVGR